MRRSRERLTQSFICTIPLRWHSGNRCSKRARKTSSSWRKLGANLCKEYRTCYYVTVSTGIGGAFTVNKQLISGGRGHAGEIGNIIVKNNGYKQGALNPGAAEGECSGTAITRKGQEALGKDLVHHAGDVFRLAAEGNETAQGIADECISELATLFANIAHTVDPHCFVVGGGVMKSKKYFLDQLTKEFNQKIHVGMRNHIPLLKQN